MTKIKEKVYWLINSDENVEYKISTWYRCVGLQKFLEKVEKENEIVGIVANGNNIGFILKKYGRRNNKRVNIK